MALKNLWFLGARALSTLSGGRVYFANLFVAARKPR